MPSLYGFPWARRSSPRRTGVATSSGEPTPDPVPDTAFIGGALTLHSTYHNIGIEFEYSGDTNGNATILAQFKKTADADIAANWRTCLPLWRIDKPQSGEAEAQSNDNKVFCGSCLLCDSGTSYDIKITPSDADGVAGSTVVTGTIATQTDNITAAASLTVTHYIATNGDNDNNGTAIGTPWLTLNKAMTDAPANAVVQVAAGSYKPAGTARSLGPITFVAASPAVDDNRAIINVGSHSIIEPTVAADPDLDLWVSTDLVGPGFGGVSPGTTYTVWKYTVAGNFTQMGYSTNRTDAPTRVTHWKKSGVGTALNTAAGWAEALYTNKTYNYGFWTDGTAVYLRMPDDINPNTKWVFLGLTDGLKFNYRNCRLSGFEIKCMLHGVNIQATDAAITDENRDGSYAVVDHCLFLNNLYGVWRAARNPATGPDIYPKYDTTQYNRFIDTSMWEDQDLWVGGVPSTGSIPWKFIKQKIRLFNGAEYATNRLGENCEGDAFSGRGGGQQSVFRYNTVIGTMNGISPGIQAGFGRYAGMNFDCHDNLFQHIPDDALEPEEQCINQRYYNNRVEEAAIFMSVGPLRHGPIYVFRNAAWRIGSRGTVPVGAAHTAYEQLTDPTFEPRIVGCCLFKYSGTSNPRARVYCCHNTFWTDQVNTAGNGNVGGGEQFAGGDLPLLADPNESFYLRNNIIRLSRNCWVTPNDSSALAWNEDRNHFMTTDITRGIEFENVNKATVLAYQQATLANGAQQGTYTNLTNGNFTDAGGTSVDDELTNPTAGTITLKVGSAFIDIGEEVDNLSERAAAGEYLGAAPDLGYAEKS